MINNSTTITHMTPILCIVVVFKCFHTLLKYREITLCKINYQLTLFIFSFLRVYFFGKQFPNLENESSIFTK